MFSNFLEKYLGKVKAIKEGNKNHEFEFRIGNFEKNTFKTEFSGQLASGLVHYIKSKKFKALRTVVIQQQQYVSKNYKEKLIHRRYSTGKEEYYGKQRIDNLTHDNVRLSYAQETNYTKSTFPSKGKDGMPVQKNRSTFQVDKYWILDLTSMDGVIQVEFELVAYDSLDKITKNILKILNEIQYKVFGIARTFRGMKSMNPHNLEKKDLKRLVLDKYTVTDKADGERFFLYLLKNGIFLINPKTKEQKMSLPNKTGIVGTVIDGEYLEKTNTFYSFDLLFSGMKDYREKYLDQRLGELEKYNKVKIQGLNYSMKKFYFDNVFEESKRVWNSRKKLFKYELDGLIFTPIEQYYSSDKQDKPVFKWKDLVSIDVRVEYDRKEDFTYFHHSSYGKDPQTWGRGRRALVSRVPGKEDKPIYFKRWSTKNRKLTSTTANLGVVKNGRLILGMKGHPGRGIRSGMDIVEYEYDYNKNQWKVLRLRTRDKEDSNKYKTVESALNSIIERISVDDLYSFKDVSSEEIGNLYDITKDETRKRDNWRKFHNYIKQHLIKKYVKKGGSLLDLGCGKGGDLFKWLETGVKNILAIDPSYNELYGSRGFTERLIGQGFTNKGKYFTNGKVNITVVWGDASKNIKKHDAGMNEEENKKIKYFFEHILEGKKFDTIQAMFMIHYLFGDTKDNKKWVTKKSKLNGFLRNIKNLLKKDGDFIGVYLNGDNIKGDMVFKKDDKMFYKITHNKPQGVRGLESINVENEVWGEGVVISEPKLYKKVLESTMKSIGIESKIKDTSVKQILEKFTRKLEPDEEKLGLINNIFVFGY